MCEREKVMDSFDFERVHKAMEYLSDLSDKWLIDGKVVCPTIEQLKHTAKEAIHDAIESRNKDRSGIVEYGGFRAIAEDDQLTLVFELTQCTVCTDDGDIWT